MSEELRIDIKAITEGVHTYFQACQERIPKAIVDGIYKESFRLGNPGDGVIRKGIEAGAPGGKPLAPWAPFTRIVGRNPKPLYRFGSAVRYKVTKTGDSAKGEVGFISDQLDTWAKKHAEGYEITLTLPQKRWMAVRLRKWGIPEARGKGAPLKVPSRPIIAQVYDAEKDTIYKNIRDKVIAASKLGGRY